MSGDEDQSREIGSEKRNPAPRTTDEDFAREALIKECEDALEKMMNEQPDDAQDFATYERKLLELVHEIARRKLEKKLQSMADGFADRLAIDHNNDWHG